MAETYRTGDLEAERERLPLLELLLDLLSVPEPLSLGSSGGGEGERATCSWLDGPEVGEVERRACCPRLDGPGVGEREPEMFVG